MQKANAIGGILSILVGVAWVLVGMTSFPAWIAVVYSMVVGAYWAFGRQLVAGDELQARNRNRNRVR